MRESQSRTEAAESERDSKKIFVNCILMDVFTCFYLLVCLRSRLVLRMEKLSRFIQPSLVG